MSDEDKTNRLKTISLLRRMLYELEKGYVPEYMSVIYPLADEKEVIRIIGFTTTKSAFSLHTHLNEMDDELHEEAVRRKTGLTSEAMDRIEDQFKRDMIDAVGRVTDSLMPDEPINDFKDAQRILGKIMSKAKKP